MSLAGSVNRRRTQKSALKEEAAMGHAQEHTIHGKGRPAEGLGRAQTNVNKGFVADSTPINASHQTRLEWT